MDGQRDTASPELDAAERAALKEAIGRPAAEQVSIAIEEVERQVALEDLLVMMVDAVRETVRAFFDFLAEVDAGALDPNHRTKKGDRE